MTTPSTKNTSFIALSSASLWTLLLLQIASIEFLALLTTPCCWTADPRGGRPCRRRLKTPRGCWNDAALAGVPIHLVSLIPLPSPFNLQSLQPSTPQRLISRSACNASPPPPPPPPPPDFPSSAAAAAASSSPPPSSSSAAASSASAAAAALPPTLSVLTIR